MNRDRNLLFGILAVQMGKVTPTQLVEAAGAWAADPTKDLASRLTAADVLSTNDRALLEAFVSEAVKAHDGDTAKTLSALGGEQQVKATFHGAITLTQSGGLTQTDPLFSDRYADPVSIPSVNEAPGRYTQVSEYGRGGMGRVLLVHDAYLSRNIALKELLPGLSDAAAPSTPARQYMNIRSRFLQEARITGQLEHPSIVPVYELGHRPDGTLYYTMKLVRGRTLRQALAEAGSLEARLRLLPHFVDLCNAIAYSHSQNVIHRDIKPANVMVGEFGETIVLDWGLAEVKGETDVHAQELAETLLQWEVGGEEPGMRTAPGEIMGTPAYMSPEQANGCIDQIDDKTDVYALGVVLYELLTGALPFWGTTAKEIIEQVINGDAPRIADLEKNAPRELAAIAERAMHKDPGNRYLSAKEMAQDVQRFLSGALVGAYDYSFSEHLRRFAGRHRAALSTAVVALAIVSVLGIYSYVNIIEARNEAVDNAKNAIVAQQAAEGSRNEAEQARITEAEARKEAEALVRRLEHANYSSGIQLAQKDIEAFRSDIARTRLMATPPHLRNWEWGYLYRALDSSSLTLSVPGVPVHSISFSPDGSRLVTASDDDTVRVWDAHSGEQLLRVEALGYIGSSYSPDGTHIVTPSDENLATVSDAAAGLELATLVGHGDTVLDARYSPDGSRIVTASADTTAKVWDAVTYRELRTLSGHADSLFSASFSPDGSRIVTASDDCTAKVWDAVTGAELLTLSGHWHWVRCASFSPDGESIVTASQDRRVKVWDAVSGLERQTLFGHRFGVTRAAYSPDGEHILSASQDGTAAIWDVASGTKLLTLSGHSNSISSASFSPDGSRVVTASLDGTAKVWERASGSNLAAILKLELGRPVLRFDLRGGAESLTLSALGGEMDCASFSPDGSRIVTASLDGTATVWDAVAGTTLWTLSGHEDAVQGASFSPDGSRIVTASADGTAKIWDAATGLELVTLTGHEDGVNSAFFSPDGSRVVTASNDGVIIVWGAASYEEILSLRSHNAAVSSATFSPDGTRIVAACDDGTAKVWDAVTGVRLLDSHFGHGGALLDASFSADGARVVTASSDGTAKVWDAATGLELVTLAGHGDVLHGASFGPDGSRIVTASLDGTAKVWDAATGLELVTLTGHGDVVLSARFSNDGARVVTASFDRTAKVWDAAPWPADAWENDEAREQLLALTLRKAPEIVERIQPTLFQEAKSTHDDIEALGMAFRHMSETDSPSAFRSVAGQGIYVQDISLLPRELARLFENHDLIIRLNDRRVHAAQDASEVFDRLKEVRQSDSSDMAMTLTMEVANLYDRTIHSLSTPGIAMREIHIDRPRMLELLNRAAAVAERDMKAARGRGEDMSAERPLYLDELAPAFQLEISDRLVLLFGNEIKGYSSLLEIVNKMREQVEAGDLSHWELVVLRETTHQYFQTTVLVDP